MRCLFPTVLGLLVFHGAGLAADLASPLPAPGQAPPVWTGFYAGLHVGGAFGFGRNAFNIDGLEFPSFDTPLTGVIGGAEAGYNWQTGPWVLGLEANFDGSGLRGSVNTPPCPLACGSLSASYAQKLPWFGTLRPRVGYALGNWLLYATGGGALGQLNTHATASAGPLVAVDNRRETREGWTLGGGVEVKLTQGWSAKIEYLYIDLGSHATALLSSPPITDASRVKTNVIDAGVNYHF